MTALELLAGTDVFWRRAAQDCARAERRLLVQAMTFEGDATGQMVAGAIAASPARDRRVLVDAYTRVVQSDRWVGWPGFVGAEQRREMRATRAMFASLTQSGVAVRETNPFAPLWLNYPARNHKKLIVTDDVAYVGGVNFSDHNFAWRDFMVRIEGAEAADFLAADFAATWAGGPTAADIDLDGLRLFALDGRANDRFFAAMCDLIGKARREIVVLSAYLTFPFTAPLAEAARRGVAVRLITPWVSNKPLVRDYLLGVARGSGFEVTLLAEMSHDKALLIDGEQLVVGSCNFDFVGLAAEEEIVAVIRSPELIADFRRQVIDGALERAASGGIGRVGTLRSATAHAMLRVAQVGVKAASRARRTAVDRI